MVSFQNGLTSSCFWIENFWYKSKKLLRKKEIFNLLSLRRILSKVRKHWNLRHFNRKNNIENSNGEVRVSCISEIIDFPAILYSPIHFERLLNSSAATGYYICINKKMKKNHEKRGQLEKGYFTFGAGKLKKGLWTFD